jgi:hypothetical protein
MNHSATIWSVIDRKTVYYTGEADAHFAPFPVYFVTNESANRSEPGFDGLMVVFRWIQASDEHR